MLQFNDVDKSEIRHKLKEVKFLKAYRDDDKILEMISGLCAIKKFKKGASIIKEGEYGDELFIILTGEIEIVKETLQGEHYTLTTLNSESGGIVVGEFALIDNDKRSASVIANTDCICLVIKRQKFIKFGNQNPLIGLNITR
jgi:CRP-like cAMP-binding protein